MLLTPAAPDFPYSGAEFFRKVVRLLPGEQVRWCYLEGRHNREQPGLPESAGFLPRGVNWRLKDGLFDVATRKFRVRRATTGIVEWLKSFNPELLWIQPDGVAIDVGLELQKALEIPVHLTFFDAPEIVIGKLSSYSAPARRWYLNRLAALLAGTTSFDAVSRELIENVSSKLCEGRPPRALCFPPSVTAAAANGGQTSSVLPVNSSVRRIALCGTLRVSSAQWTRFAGLLGALPFTFELLVYSDRNYFPAGALPGNVTLKWMDYLATEAELIHHIRAARVQACYLGLWNDGTMNLFCRTSLSSKLATYVAAGLPVIVDGPEESVAWRLVDSCGAGVRLDGAPSSVADEKALGRMFSDSSFWNSLATGASRLWDREFNMDANIDRFRLFLEESARTSVGGRQ